MVPDGFDFMRGFWGTSLRSKVDQFSGLKIRYILKTLILPHQYATLPLNKSMCLLLGHVSFVGLLYALTRRMYISLKQYVRKIAWTGISPDRSVIV